MYYPCNRDTGYSYSHCSVQAEEKAAKEPFINYPELETLGDHAPKFAFSKAQGRFVILP